MTKLIAPILQLQATLPQKNIMISDNIKLNLLRIARNVLPALFFVWCATSIYSEMQQHEYLKYLKVTASVSLLIFVSYYLLTVQIPGLYKYGIDWSIRERETDSDNYFKMLELVIVLTIVVNVIVALITA